MTHSIHPSRVDRDSKQESVNRARRSVLDLVFFGLRSDSKFLTLTFAKATVDRSYVRGCINNMCNRYLLEYGRPLPYLSVLEFHPAGHGYHVHMLVNSPFISQADWQGKLWRQGIVDIRSVRRLDNVDHRIDLANYLLKYLEKDVADLPPGSRRYNVSKSWPKVPSAEYVDEVASDAFIAYLLENKDKPGFSVRSHDSELPTGERVTSIWSTVPNTKDFSEVI